MCLLRGRVANYRRSRPDWGADISTCCLELILLLCGPVEFPVFVAGNGKAICLREGLPDPTVTPPELVLDFGANQEPMRFTVDRLERMTRSTVTVRDHTAKRTRTFEGVDISWLVRSKHQPRGGRDQVTVQTLRREGDVSGEGSQWDALEVSFGLCHRKKIPRRELGANSKVIILDTVDGKTLPGYDPFLPYDRNGAWSQVIIETCEMVIG